MIDNMVMIKFFLQGVPETAAVIFVSFALVGYRAKLKDILGWATIITFVVYLLRFWAMGMHNIVAIVLLVLILYRVAKVPAIRSFIIALTVNFVLAMLEFFTLRVLDMVFGYKLTLQPTPGDWLWIISGWPQIIILFIVGYYLYKFNYRLFGRRN